MEIESIQDFIYEYQVKDSGKPKIEVTVDWLKLCHSKDIFIKKRNINKDRLKEFYCPWYIDVKSGKEIEGIEDVLKKINKNIENVEIIQIKNIDSNLGKLKTNRDNKGETIKQYKDKIEADDTNFDSIPVAYDIGSKKRLLLDSNKSCSALFLSNCKRTLQIYEICGNKLEDIFKDFEVLNKSK